MDFATTLARHLDAITHRDFAGFADTVATGEVVLISATGELTTSADHVLSLHREWFSSPSWSMETEVRHTRERGDLATAVIALNYHEDKPDGAIDVPSVLSLVFERRDGRWLMVQDQNTPVTAGTAGGAS